MTDSSHHDPAFHDRISEVIRGLNGSLYESDEELESQLDAAADSLAASGGQLTNGETTSILQRTRELIHQSEAARPAGGGSPEDAAPIDRTVRPAMSAEPSFRGRPTGTAGGMMISPGRMRPAGMLSLSGVVLALYLTAGSLLWRTHQPGSDLPVADSLGVVKLSMLMQRDVTQQKGRPLLRRSPSENRQPAIALQVGETVSTGPYERKRVRLPDGSVAFLNVASTLSAVTARRFALPRGEAYFEVMPVQAEGLRSDPFVVQTEHETFTAVGTQFVVDAADERADGTAEHEVSRLVVTQGSVRVPGGPHLVEAGQEVILPQVPADGRGGQRRSAARPAKRASAVLGWMRELLAEAAPEIVPVSKHRGGSVTVLDSNGQETKLSMRKFHVDVHIEDGFARTTIDQTYFNHTRSRQEGTFRFPLPPDASLSRLAMYVNGRLMEGGMVERAHGRNVYEQIRHTRRDPALLEWIDGSTFSMRVFPLEPRQEKRIILSYTQRLPKDYGKLTYRFPAGHTMERVDEWSTRLRIVDGRTDRLRWFSPSHLLRTVEDAGESERASAADAADASDRVGDLVLRGSRRNAAFDRDLVLELEAERRDSPDSDSVPPAAVTTVTSDGFRYLMVRLQPELPGELERPKRNWVFVVETSADRNDVLWKAQREVLRTLLDHVEHSDTFSLILASTRSEVFRSKPVPCGRGNVEAAIAFLDEAPALGALDLSAALKAAEPFCRSESVENWIVHIGSAVGVIGRRDESALLDALPRLSRFAGVGVGHRWNRSFMRAAASRTGGHFTQINPDEEVTWRAFEFLSAINAPRLLELSVSCGRKDVRFLTFAETIADGQEVAAIARFDADAELPQSVTLQGRVDGREWVRTLPVDPGVTIDGDSAASYLPRVWAKLEIDRLVSAGAERFRSTITELSKSMYVMSPFTSLLVLENDAMYEQFGVDRGRKDHWALYPAPESVDAETENERPGPATVDSVEVVCRRLEQAIDARDAAKRNLLAAEKASASDRQILTLRSQLADAERRVTQLTERRNTLQRLRDDEILNAARSVIPRRRAWQTSAEGWSGDGVRLLGFPADDRMRNIDFTDSFQTDLLMWGESSGSIQWQRRSEGSRPAVLWEVPSPGWGSGVPLLTAYSDAGRGGLHTTQGRGMFIPGMVSFQQQPPSTYFDGRFRPHWIDSRAKGFASKQPDARRFFFRFSTDLGDEYDFDFTQGFVTQRFGLAGRPNPGRSNVNLRFVPGGGSSVRGESDFLLGRRMPVSGQWSWLPNRASTEFEVRQPGTEPGVAAVPQFAMPPSDLSDLRRLTALVPTQRFDPSHSLTSAVPLGKSQLMDKALSREIQMVIEPAGWRDSGSRFIIPDDALGSWPFAVAGGQRHGGFIFDPLDRCPGMNSGAADQLAAMGRAAEEAGWVNQGTISTEAADLLSRVRNVGWESVTVTGTGDDDQRGTPSVTIQANGAGQFRLERVLPDGVREIIVCDGESLWHLYPDFAVGARRDAYLLGDALLQSLLPWYVADPALLSRGADIELAGQRTLRITPLASARQQTGESSDADASVPPRSVLEMVFDENARLTERRLVDPVSGKVRRRIECRPDGTVTVTVDGESLGAVRSFVRRAGDVPDLDPADSETVILPLPYRTVQDLGFTFAEKDDGTADYSELSQSDALRLIAAYLASGPDAAMYQVMEQCFFARGDYPLGFATLLHSGNPREVTAIQTATSRHPDHPLSRYLRQAAQLSLTGRADGGLTLPDGASHCLKTIAMKQNIYSRWVGGAVFEGRSGTELATQLSADLETMNGLNDEPAVWILLRTIAGQLPNAGDSQAFLYRLLASFAAERESRPSQFTGSRVHRVKWLLRAGSHDTAGELYADYLQREARTIAESGGVIVLDSEIHEKLDRQVWKAAVLDEAATLISLQAEQALIALAGACLQLEETELADELFDRAFSVDQAMTQSRLAAAALPFLIRRERYPEAEACFRSVFDDRELARNSSLWRHAADSARALGDLDEASRRMEYALELDIAQMPDAVDVEQLRSAFDATFDLLEEAVVDLLENELPLPADVSRRIRALGDRWRSLDPDVTTSCFRTARLFSLVGLPFDAWDYWTSPLAQVPNSSAAWSTLAEELGEQGLVDRASAAWAEAFAFESTNPEYLLKHALLMKQAGRHRRAASLLDQILRGKWQPRFNGTREQARQLRREIRP